MTERKIGSSEKEVRPVLAYHKRLPYQSGDNTKVFVPFFAAEQPAPDNLSSFDPQVRHLLDQRQRAKRATDLSGNPILGQPLNMSQEAPSEIIAARKSAAQEVVDSWLSDDFVQQFAEYLYPQLSRSSDRTTTFIKRVSVAGPSERHNFLSPVYEDRLIASLERAFSRIDPHNPVSFETVIMPMATIPKRTESNPLERIVRQPYLDERAKHKLTGRKLVLLDDHVQAGGTFATFFAVAKELGKGTEVLGITALTAHPTLRDLRISEQVKDRLLLYCDKRSPMGRAGAIELDTSLSKIGLSIDTLTNREAFYLIGMMMDGFNMQERKTYLDLIDEIGEGVRVAEGKEDNFEQFLHTSPMTLPSISIAMDGLIDERLIEIKTRVH
jgi:hypothetical protein